MGFRHRDAAAGAVDRRLRPSRFGSRRCAGWGRGVCARLV